MIAALAKIVFGGFTSVMLTSAVLAACQGKWDFALIFGAVWLPLGCLNLWVLRREVFK